MAHLRDVLSDQTYESLARKGKTMTTAAIVTYGSDQIDQAPNITERRLELDLERVSNFGSEMAQRYAGHC